MKRFFIVFVLVTVLLLVFCLSASALNVSDSTNEIQVSALMKMFVEQGWSVSFTTPFDDLTPGRVTFDSPTGYVGNQWYSTSVKISELLPNYEQGAVYWWWWNGGPITFRIDGEYYDASSMSPRANGYGATLSADPDATMSFKFNGNSSITNYVGYPVFIKTTASVYNNIWGNAEYPRPVDFTKGYQYFPRNDVNRYGNARYILSLTAYDDYHQNPKSYSWPLAIIPTYESIFIKTDVFEGLNAETATLTGTFEEAYQYIYSSAPFVTTVNLTGGSGLFRVKLRDPVSNTVVTKDLRVRDGSGGGFYRYEVNSDTDVNYNDWLLESFSISSTLSSFRGGFDLIQDNTAYFKGFEDGRYSGYDEGYTKGFNVSVTEARAEAYDEGYIKGKADGSTLGGDDQTFFGLMSAVVRAPVTVLFGLLDVDILGVNMRSVFLMLIVLAVVIIIMRFIFSLL